MSLFEGSDWPSALATIVVGAITVPLLLKQQKDGNKVRKADLIQRINNSLNDYVDVRIAIILKNEAIINPDSRFLVRIRDYGIIFETIEFNICNKLITKDEFSKYFGKRYGEFSEFLNENLALSAWSGIRDVRRSLERLDEIIDLARSRSGKEKF